MSNPSPLMLGIVHLNLIEEATRSLINNLSKYSDAQKLSVWMHYKDAVALSWKVVKENLIDTGKAKAFPEKAGEWKTYPGENMGLIYNPDEGMPVLTVVMVNLEVVKEFDQEAADLLGTTPDKIQ